MGTLIDLVAAFFQSPRFSRHPENRSGLADHFREHGK